MKLKVGYGGVRSRALGRAMRNLGRWAEESSRLGDRAIEAAVPVPETIHQAIETEEEEVELECWQQRLELEGAPGPREVEAARSSSQSLKTWDGNISLSPLSLPRRRISRWDIAVE